MTSIGSKAFGVALALLCLLAPAALGAAPPLTIFGAASLTNALTDIGTLWEAKGHRLKFSFGASSALAVQIEHGAPADVFVSADELWMDELAHAGRIVPATRFDFAANTLVLVERKDRLKAVKIGPGFNLASVLGPQGRLAVGNPAGVPAGLYAQQALIKLGLWASVKDRLAPAETVRAALLLVSRGEAPAGIVYGTDVRMEPSLAVAGTFPSDSHDPIRYPAAAVTRGHQADARAFLDFLRTEPAHDVLEHYGFPAP